MLEIDTIYTSQQSSDIKVDVATQCDKENMSTDTGWDEWLCKTKGMERVRGHVGKTFPAGQSRHNFLFASDPLPFVINGTAFGFRRQVTREYSIHDPGFMYCGRIWIKSFLNSSTKC